MSGCNTKKNLFRHSRQSLTRYSPFLIYEIKREKEYGTNINNLFQSLFLHYNRLVDKPCKFIHWSINNYSIKIAYR